MLAIRLPERNILKDLRRIFLALDADIPSTRVETLKQRYITLCNQLRTIPLMGMSYAPLAVLNVVDLLKYWHMTYDADSSQGSSSQTRS